MVPIAVERLNKRFRGRGEFVVTDLGGEAAPAAGTYSTVTAMNVLLHILDEDAFDRALAHLARLVQPGGHLVIADPVLLEGAPVLADTSRTRRLGRYVEVLRSHGLDLMDVAPTTVLGADPIEARSRWERRVSRRWWHIVARADRRGFGSLVGLAIYLADPIALKTGWAPSGKFLLFRRPQVAADA